MAGYIFGLDSLASLHLYTLNGVYATKLSSPAGSWKAHHEGTFADYCTMHAGDNIYFFIQRRIYGIGRLVSVGGDCKYFNFPGASEPRRFNYRTAKSSLLWDERAHSVDQRCVCLFEPDPHFFSLGIDMDDVLSSNPAAFKMLRAFWKLSFIKFDDDENQAFRDIVLKRNQAALSEPSQGNGVFEFQPVHNQIEARSTGAEYAMQAGMGKVLASCAARDYLKHEMAVEAGILHQISVGEPHTRQVFGTWDYLSHQVVASPFKPIDYMDKMDLFGYSYVPGHRPTKARFMVGEVKKGAARSEDIDQLLKYVDWVRDEYCYGDYSMIRAFLVAHSFDDDALQHARTVGMRRYTVGVRPAKSLAWSDVTLVRYAFETAAAKLSFAPVP